MNNSIRPLTRKNNPSARLSVLAALPLLWGGLSARAEIVVSAYLGSAMTEDTDVHLRQPGGTSLTLHDAPFKGKDFDMPLYYGGRIAYFLEREQSGFGFGVEFFHAKAYLETSESVHVTGTRAGVPVDAVEPITDSIHDFNNSHGLNFLTADVIYRWVFAERDKSFLGRLQPYIGAGVGAVIPHVESEVGGVSFEEYQWHGPGVQAFGGLNFDLTRHISLFAEYKFTYADLDEDIPGGSIQYEPHTHHLVGGVSFSF